MQQTKRNVVGLIIAVVIGLPILLTKVITTDVNKTLDEAGYDYKSMLGSVLNDNAISIYDTLEFQSHSLYFKYLDTWNVQSTIVKQGLEYAVMCVPKDSASYNQFVVKFFKKKLPVEQFLEYGIRTVTETYKNYQFNIEPISNIIVEGKDITFTKFNVLVEDEMFFGQLSCYNVYNYTFFISKLSKSKYELDTAFDLMENTIKVSI